MCFVCVCIHICALCSMHVHWLFQVCITIHRFIVCWISNSDAIGTCFNLICLCERSTLNVYLWRRGSNDAGNVGGCGGIEYKCVFGRMVDSLDLSALQHVGLVCNFFLFWRRRGRRCRCSYYCIIFFFLIKLKALKINHDLVANAVYF